MIHEKSCGALVFRTDESGTEYILLIRQRGGGARSFPKGHVESGESEHETAIREVMEETGVRIQITSPFRRTVTYSPTPGVIKKVVYFQTDTNQTETHAREGEIAAVDWVPTSEAERKLAHENDRAVFRAAMAERNAVFK